MNDTSPFFIEIQRNELLHAQGVVFLDTGHHLTSHPMESKIRMPNT